MNKYFKISLWALILVVIAGIGVLVAFPIHRGPSKEFIEKVTTSTTTNQIDLEWEQKRIETEKDFLTWPTYTNKELGFSLKYPEIVDNGKGGSKITFTQKNNIVYIAPTDFSFDKEEPFNESTLSYYGSWKIVVRNIKSEKELDQFIKDKYGEGCKLGEMKPSHQEGVLDVGIDAVTPGEADEGSCFLNWVLVVKYAPQYQKAVIWDIGQDSDFYLLNGYPADGFMEDSFTFIGN